MSGQLADLAVNELYGPVFQGEGPLTGRPFVFLRLAGCNLDCSWCDTPYSWDWSRYDPLVERTRMTPMQLRQDIMDRWQGAPHAGLCITGGEPLLQQSRLAVLLVSLEGGRHVSVETNGTRVPIPDLYRQVDSWVVSPKLPHSGVEWDKAIRNDVLEQFGTLSRRGRDVAFKVVVEADPYWGTTDTQLDAVAAIQSLAGVGHDRMWVMPQAVHSEDLLDSGVRVLEGQVLRRGWNFTMRNQVLLHDGRRGV